MAPLSPERIVLTSKFGCAFSVDDALDTFETDGSSAITALALSLPPRCHRLLDAPVRTLAVPHALDATSNGSSSIA